MSRLITLAGWGYTSGILEPMTSHVPAPHNSRRLDLAACWEAAPPTSPVDASRFLPGLENLIADEPAPFFLLGWSTGALLAWEFAWKHPERIAGLFLISATPRFTQTEEFPTGCPPAELRALRAGLRRNPVATLHQFQQQVQFPHPDPDPIWERCRSDHENSLRAGLEYLAQTDMRNAAPASLEFPTWILHGKKDQVIPVNACRLAAGLLQAKETVRYPHVGHSLPVVYARPLAGYVTSYMEWTEKKN